ncbi:MAG: glycosyltransferase family 2 protein [Caulobacterales bacterium]
MPRPLAEYTLADWGRLRPILHAMKARRYRRVTDHFTAQPARLGDLAALPRRIEGARLIVTIAFNDPEILERQIGALRRFVTGALHLVADNSSDDAAALRLEALCARTSTPYLRLPANPWGPKSASRSHGLALDWVWRNLIRPGRPQMFGFLDHDLIPTAPCDPFEPLARQGVHGDKRWAGERWFLWAGYCFFRPEALEGARVDFGQDWFVGLDTGGGNWAPVYSRLDPASLEDRPIEAVAALPGVPVAECYFERRGEWLHEVGFGGRPDLKAAKRRQFLALIDAALAPGADGGVQA